MSLEAVWGTAFQAEGTTSQRCQCVLCVQRNCEEVCAAPERRPRGSDFTGALGLLGLLNGGPGQMVEQGHQQWCLSGLHTPERKGEKQGT